MTVTPAVVALASGAGLADIVVRRRPIVAVLATGDEVRAAGTELGPAGIPDANGPGIRALVREAGGMPLELGIAADRLEDVESQAAARDRRGRHRGRVGRGLGRAVRRRAAGVRRRRSRQPVARRGAAGQAVRVRPRRRRGRQPPGPAVRPAGQPRLVVRHLRAVRATGDPTPGRARRGCIDRSIARCSRRPCPRARAAAGTSG